MDIELIQLALNVLRACTENIDPCLEDIAVLKSRLGAEAEGMAIDELARTIIERSMLVSRRTASRG